MVVLDNDGFLTGLTKFFQNSKTSGSVFLTMKKCMVTVCIVVVEKCGIQSVDNGRTKPRPRKSKTGAGADHVVDENLCLLRASNGKKKISTVVC